MRVRLTTPPPMIPRVLPRNRFYGVGSTRPTRAARQFARIGAVPSADSAITDTGLKGFLKWVKREYPAQLYQTIATQIQQQIPQAFSNYMLGGWRNVAKMNGLADANSGTVDTADAANSGSSSPSWSDQVAQIIGSATGAYVSISQQQNQSAILQAQLQQAQAGKPPLNISLASSGVTFGAQGSLTGGQLLVFGGIGLLVLKALRVF